MKEVIHTRRDKVSNSCHQDHLILKSNLSKISDIRLTAEVTKGRDRMRFIGNKEMDLIKDDTKDSRTEI